MVSKSFDINTDSLLPIEPSTRRLLLELSPGTVSVILWNKEKELPEALEVFNGSHESEEDWQAMVQQSRLLGLNQTETLVVHAYEAMLPIPAALYSPETAKEQLQLFYGGRNDGHTSADVIEDPGMLLAWQLPGSIYQFLTDHFKILQVKHVTAALLDNAKPGDQAKGNLIIYGNLGWVILWNKWELLIVKSVTIAQPDDLSWHLLNICRHFDLQPSEVSWEVSGMAEESSPLWSAVTRFFDPVTAMPTTVTLPEELPGHYFGHLFRAMGRQ